VLKGDELTTFVVPKVEKNPEALTFRIPKGLLRPVAGKLSLYHVSIYLVSDSQPRSVSCNQFINLSRGTFRTHNVWHSYRKAGHIHGYFKFICFSK
jgi:hypothetical protein